MLLELTEVTPEPAYAHEHKSKPDTQPKPKDKQRKVNIPMDILDAKVREILAQVSLEEDLPHNTPNVERYMGLFSLPKENKVEVKTVEDIPKNHKSAKDPLSSLICSVPEDNPPMETKEDWIRQDTPAKVEEVKILQDLIADNEKPICLPKNGSSMHKLVEVINTAKKLLKETKIKMTWAQLCKYCPQFQSALKQAVSDTFTRKKLEQLLINVSPSRTLGTVDGVPITIILDDRLYTNIVTKRFLYHLGITNIAPSTAQYILADGRQEPCISTVQGALSAN
ncbi:hypothetical protein DSO57_1005364 [Entomophthora muscae]|uniref:Uncharacterized protein n=1 Tax=Entomophthora muscae TaxID=34485 RepID=A0ACC2RMP0_9FUNG|nr:hypothetical protein DSO57_1005364 [Entomophthora muscae]